MRLVLFPWLPPTILAQMSLMLKHQVMNQPRIEILSDGRYLPVGVEAHKVDEPERMPAIWEPKSQWSEEEDA